GASCAPRAEPARPLLELIVVENVGEAQPAHAKPPGTCPECRDELAGDNARALRQAVDCRPGNGNPGRSVDGHDDHGNPAGDPQDTVAVWRPRVRVAPHATKDGRAGDAGLAQLAYELDVQRPVVA